MFETVLFVIIKNWKQSNVQQQVNGQIIQWYIYIMEYHSEWARIHAAWMSFKIIMLNEIIQTKENTCWTITFIANPKKCKFKYNDRKHNRNLPGWGWGRKGLKERNSKEHEESFGVIGMGTFPTITIASQVYIC